MKSSFQGLTKREQKNKEKHWNRNRYLCSEDNCLGKEMNFNFIVID